MVPSVGVTDAAFPTMADPANDSPESPSSGSLYQDFLAERDEVLRHKWLKSEEVGRDIGFEAALVEWMLHHRATWLEEGRPKSETPDSD